MFNILWYINTYICMLNAFVHVCVMNNILMIIITLHSIEKSSNNISPIYLNKSTDNSSSTRHPYRMYNNNMPCGEGPTLVLDGLFE